MADDDRRPWAIVGFGLGGSLLAAELGLRGIQLRVFDISSEMVEAVERAGGLEVSGSQTGFVRLSVKSNLAEAIEGASTIIISVPAPQHGPVARMLAPHVVNGQVIVLIQGHFGGALEVTAELKAAGSPGQVVVAEMDMFPFFGGREHPNRVSLDPPRSSVAVASISTEASTRVVELISLGIPGAHAAPTVLHTGLSDMSPLLHSIPMILNVGTVDRSREYRFYRDMMSDSVVRVIHACDHERRRLATAYGVDLPSVFDYYRTTHEIEGETLLELLLALGESTFRFAPAPKTFRHRYIDQDLGATMVGWATIGGIAEVSTPALTSLVTLAGVIAGTDYWTEGRNAHRLGLENAHSVDDVLNLLGVTDHRSTHD